MSQGSGARILVVDDEPGIVRAVQTNLGRHDFRVDIATTGAGLLGPLFWHDQTDHTNLVATLETYLDTACNASRTAEILRVHRNNMANRLQHIKELADVDLEEPDMRVFVQLT